MDLCLSGLLSPAETQLRERGIDTLVYIGLDLWLITALERQGFRRENSISLFRKQGWKVPATGNEEIGIRPATSEDIPALVGVDEAAFREDMWRNSADAFQRCLNRMPHFVVAEHRGQVVGYQFSYIRGREGYLARVAVHPGAQGQGIGTRLVAEAIRFFRTRGVRSIALNTQRDNYRAQRLYRWFGFRPVEQEAVVLQKRVGQWAETGENRR